MTAGRGIAHSERSGEKQRATARNIHGLQSWIALPKEFEEMPPEFHHHAASSLPEFSHNGVDFKLICGRAFGYEAPVKTYSPLFYVEAKIPANRHFILPPEYVERALYLVSGKVRIGNTIITAMTMPVFTHGETITVEALEPSHLMLLGGDPLSEPRYIDWNFVSSSRERLEQAKADWEAQRFPTIPNDDHEFIPLPK